MWWLLHEPTSDAPPYGESLSKMMALKEQLVATGSELLLEMRRWLEVRAPFQCFPFSPFNYSKDPAGT